MGIRARIVTLMLVGAFLAGCSGLGNSGKAAIVNGKALPLADFNKQVQLVQNSMVSQGLDPKTADGKAQIEQLREDVLNQMIDIELMRQAVDKEGIKVTEADVNDRMAQMKKDAGGDDAFKTSLKDANLTEQEFRTLIVRDQIIYERLYDKLTKALPQTAEQVRARHILLNTEKEATDAQARLAKGEEFAALAEAISLDSGSKDSGGDLGFVPRGFLDPAFEDLIFKLKVNEIGSVKTDYGYHVVQVLDHQADRQLEPEILQILGEEAINSYMDDVRSKANIERLVTFTTTPTPSQ